MINLNYILPPWTYQEWYALSRLDQIQIEAPPKHLHLEIDITKLNQNDIDWIRTHCSQILPELKQLLDEHNEKIKQYQYYQESIQSYEKKIKPPKILKKIQKKAPRVYQ